MKSVYIKCIAALLCLTLLTGCSGGSIYSNYREIEQLMIVQTMGFDLAPAGYTVSVSTGGASKPVRMAAEAGSISLAENKLQDYSAAEQIFYSQVSYIAIGETAAKEGIGHYLDFVERAAQIRLDTPLFIVTGDSASKLVLGSGNEEYDATNVLKSLERNLELRGDSRIFSARDVISDLDRSGAALICAVRCVKADEALYEAEDALTALPDGYAVIKDGKMIGQISYRDAVAVSILQNKIGPCRFTAKTESGSAAVQLEKCEAKIEPVFQGSTLRALRIDVNVDAAQLEGGGAELNEIKDILEKGLRTHINNVLNLSKLSSCDFLQLGSILEKKQPVTMAGMGENFYKLLPDIEFELRLTAEIDRSFDSDMEGKA